MPGEPPPPDPPTPQKLSVGAAGNETLVRRAPEARVEHRRTRLLPNDGERQSLGVVYEIDDPDKPTINPSEIMIYVEQSFDADGRERWWITNLALPTRTGL